LAGIDEGLRKLPQGYDNQLGKWFEAGEELSVGQWQKIALARAFLRRAPITILDEPTSALDAAMELEVIERFQELTRERTAILVSHRLSTVKMADRIIVLENGGIVEEGSHRELMAKNGVYARLFSSQAQHYQ
jgi:ATP-binding cassette subfamily B protein